MDVEVLATGFVDWVNEYDISSPVTSIADLADGAILFEILHTVDSKRFKLNRGHEVGENWVMRFNNLKRLHRLLIRHFEEHSESSASERGGEPTNLDGLAKDTPNLTIIAKESDPAELVKLCQLVVYIACQGETASDCVAKIQRLTQTSQKAMMFAIERVLVLLGGADMSQGSASPLSPPPHGGPSSSSSSSSSSSGSNKQGGGTAGPGQGQREGLGHTRGVSGSHHASTFEFTEEDEKLIRLQSDYNRLKAEREELERQHRAAIDDQMEQRAKVEELNEECTDLRLRLREMEQAASLASESGKADFFLRTEIDSYRLELQKSEQQIHECEQTIEKQNLTIVDLSRKVESLGRKAELAAKYKDQLHEHKHLEEKLARAEMLRDKYRKKLEESGDMKKQIKSLEEQNSQVGERLAFAEEEYRKVQAFKPMMDSYKDQVQQLTSKINQMVIEKNKLDYDIRRYQEKLTITELERQRDQDQISTLEDRMRELEFGGDPSLLGPRDDDDDEEDDDEVGEGEDDVTLGEDGEPIGGGSGSTGGSRGSRPPNAKVERRIFELKSRITSLERENDSLRHERSQDGADHRVKLLESMLDDANKLKDQFQQDFLNAKKHNMLLDNEISRLEGGVDHDLSLSLRQRLNESEEALQGSRRKLAETEVTLEECRKDLIVAKSNLNLVDKDKVDALNEMRKEAQVGMEDLSREHAALKTRVADLENESGSRLERLNQLLIEKDQLQALVVKHKDEMLEKEKTLSELKAQVAIQDSREAYDVETAKSHLEGEIQRGERLAEENALLKEQVAQLQVKMQKAKEFIKQQDHQHRGSLGGLGLDGPPTPSSSSSHSYSSSIPSSGTGLGPHSSVEEALAATRTELRNREEEMERLRWTMSKQRSLWRKEQGVMLTAWYELGRRVQRDHLATQRTGTTWLSAQRRAVDIQTKRR